MAILIQKLTNIVNIIDTAKPAGKTIIMALSVDCVAKPQIKAPNPDQVEILDAEGLPTYTITFTPTLEVQDFGGAPVVFVGTLDDLVNKLNDEYFNNAVTTAGGGGGGDASAANQLTQITEIQKLTGANSPSHAEITNPSSVNISGWKKISFVCTGSIAVIIDFNIITYPYSLGGAATIYGATFEADDITTNAVTFNGTGTVLITTKQ
jgi:hypothetical protein